MLYQSKIVYSYRSMTTTTREQRFLIPEESVLHSRRAQSNARPYEAAVAEMNNTNMFEASQKQERLFAQQIYLKQEQRLNKSHLNSSKNKVNELQEKNKMKANVIIANSRCQRSNYYFSKEWQKNQSKKNRQQSERNLLSFEEISIIIQEQKNKSKQIEIQKAHNQQQILQILKITHSKGVQTQKQKLLAIEQLKKQTILNEELKKKYDCLRQKFQDKSKMIGQLIEAKALAINDSAQKAFQNTKLKVQISQMKEQMEKKDALINDRSSQIVRLTRELSGTKRKVNIQCQNIIAISQKLIQE